MIFAGAYTLFCVSLGPELMVLAFGDKYDAALTVIPWIALMVATRMLRIAPSLMALALAKPKCELYANLARSIAIPLSIAGISAGYGLECVAIAGLIGEVLAFVVGCKTLQARVFEASFWQDSSLLANLFLGTMILTAVSVLATHSQMIYSASAILSGCVITLMCFFYQGQMRAYIADMRGSLPRGT